MYREQVSKHQQKSQTIENQGHSQSTSRPQQPNMFDNINTLTTLTSNTNTAYTKNEGNKAQNLLQEINNLDKEINQL